MVVCTLMLAVCPLLQESHLKGHRAGKFVSMGFSVPAVLLALAYQASIRGDRDSQVRGCKPGALLPLRTAH